MLVGLITSPLIPDQHWSEDQGDDPVEHEGSFLGLLRWCTKDRLRADGEGLLPAFPEVRHLQGFTGLHIRVSEDLKKACTREMVRVDVGLCPVLDYQRRGLRCTFAPPATSGDGHQTRCKIRPKQSNLHPELEDASVFGAISSLKTLFEEDSQLCSRKIIKGDILKQSVQKMCSRWLDIVACHGQCTDDMPAAERHKLEHLWVVTHEPHIKCRSRRVLLTANPGRLWMRAKKNWIHSTGVGANQHVWQLLAKSTASKTHFFLTYWHVWSQRHCPGDI